MIHALAYSFIAYQAAYLATKYPEVYWDTACLVVNSGSLEDDENEVDDETVSRKKKGTNYEKVAKAIGAVKDKGIKVSLIDINTSDYGYKPDAAGAHIIYGLKALSGINEETIEAIKAGRPYIGIKDFMNRCKIDKTGMITLIKSGAFDDCDKDFHSRIEIMAYYLMVVSEPKKKLTMQNFNGLIEHDLLPTELNFERRVFGFNKYLKTFRKWKEYYTFDTACDNFYSSNFDLEKLCVIDGVNCILQSDWDKIYKSKMETAKAWLTEHQEEMLIAYNSLLFKEMWDKYAGGSLADWEMDSVVFYDHPHPLTKVDGVKYGLVSFKDLNPVSTVERYWKRGGREIPIYELSHIIGTCIAKNDARSSISLLTTTGVVTVKMAKAQYAKFKMQISQKQPDGKKKIVEKSWFKRGTKLFFTGYRRDDQFIVKTYNNTATHQIYKITNVLNDGSIEMTSERAMGEESEEEA